MNQQAENLGFKATSVAGIIITIVMGLSAMAAMQQAGITSAVDRSKEYTNLRIIPVENDVKILKENQDEIKKKISELQHK